ncbi:hypothetical protein V8E53_005965 [Lactarius tabidus]
MIFLSDGEGYLPETEMQDLCCSAIQHGKPLSFHAVAFGPDTSSKSDSNGYRTLRTMAQIALESQRYAPPDPLFPAAARVPSSFCTALDTVRLAETFLGIAESLRKTRGSLMR